jgi:hypothetical protein
LLHLAAAVAAHYVLIWFKQVLATQTGLLDHCKLEDADSRLAFRRDNDITRVVSLEQYCFGLILENGLKYPEQRLLDLMVQVPLVVDWEIVLKHIQRVFRLFVAFRTFEAFDHHISYTVSNSRSRCFVSVTHLVCQLNVCLFSCVLLLAFASIILWLGSLSESLCDYQHREVNSVLQQITDLTLAVFNCLV